MVSIHLDFVEGPRLPRIGLTAPLRTFFSRMPEAAGLGGPEQNAQILGGVKIAPGNQATSRFSAGRVSPIQ
jgi:hypothetical protein